MVIVETRKRIEIDTKTRDRGLESFGKSHDELELFVVTIKYHFDLGSNNT